MPECLCGPHPLCRRCGQPIEWDKPINGRPGSQAYLNVHVAFRQPHDCYGLTPVPFECSCGLIVYRLNGTKRLLPSGAEHTAHVVYDPRLTGEAMEKRYARWFEAEERLAYSGVRPREKPVAAPQRTEPPRDTHPTPKPATAPPPAATQRPRPAPKAKEWSSVD